MGCVVLLCAVLSTPAGAGPPTHRAAPPRPPQPPLLSRSSPGEPPPAGEVACEKGCGARAADASRRPPGRPAAVDHPGPSLTPPPPGRSQFGDCGNPGAGLRGGFTVRGHEFTPLWIDRTLHGVIAARCESKTYRDILSLDGGTVGIAHFASGSLLTLYNEMDARRYFGRDARDVPERPFALPWWREGMRRFLASPEAKAAQQRAWRAYISPALDAALQHGWSTDRQLAIAASVANSLGAYGFQHLAEENRWDPERTLWTYSRLSAHKERRRQRLDVEFPRPPQNS